ncbi:eukaryotic translation initiation factor 3 subunit A-like [Perca fluviatilis]|uniref:eukaryotic translation initiation factor 3 subunit A-like n=1 Tax=Perca fluviatilis TaxID=8168 RepID=UPI00196450D9|nr:eukaryotic translation initiation factor 3 subunit A-like [Perca fluviatilis]
MATIVPKTVRAQLEDLRKALLEVQKQKEELAAVNAGLVEEKGNILKALQSERRMRNNFEKDRKLKESEKDEEIRLLKESLTIEKNLTEAVKSHWSSEFEQFNASITEENRKMRQAWQDEINLIKLKKKDSVMQKKLLMSKNTDLMLQNKDLMSKKEVISERLRQLEKNSREMEDGWHVKEEEMEILRGHNTDLSLSLQELEKKSREMEDGWNIKEAQREEEMEILRGHNTDLSLSLQELEKKSREMEDGWNIKEARREEEMEILRGHNTDLSLSLQELEKKSREMEDGWNIKEAQKKEERWRSSEGTTRTSASASRN